MKAILINAQNIVSNVIVWREGDVWHGPETVIVVDDSNTVAPGYIFNGGTSFTAPTIKIPEEILALQNARAAAKQAALSKLMALGLTEEEALALGSR